MFGGVTRSNGSAPREITSELWALDTTTQSWERKQVVPDLCYRAVCGPLAVVGHSAVVVGDDRMLLLFGHSPVYGYVNYVQTYHFGRWLRRLMVYTSSLLRSIDGLLLWAGMKGKMGNELSY